MRKEGTAWHVPCYMVNIYVYVCRGHDAYKSVLVSCYWYICSVGVMSMYAIAFNSGKYKATLYVMWCHNLGHQQPTTATNTRPDPTSRQNYRQPPTATTTSYRSHPHCKPIKIPINGGNSLRQQQQVAAE